MTYLTFAAVQRQNTIAVAVWRRVKEKLDGKDFDSNFRLTVAEQVCYYLLTQLNNEVWCV